MDSLEPLTPNDDSENVPGQLIAESETFAQETLSHHSPKIPTEEEDLGQILNAGPTMSSPFTENTISGPLSQQDVLPNRIEGISLQGNKGEHFTDMVSGSVSDLTDVLSGSESIENLRGTDDNVSIGIKTKISQFHQDDDSSKLAALRINKDNHPFTSHLEPKPSESPPLLLLQSSNRTIEDDTVFSNRELNQIPDQILAEGCSSDQEELDERTEKEIASNIEEQLREFEGSDDESCLNKDTDELGSLEDALAGISPIKTFKDNDTLDCGEFASNNNKNIGEQLTVDNVALEKVDDEPEQTDGNKTEKTDSLRILDDKDHKKALSSEFESEIEIDNEKLPIETIQDTKISEEDESLEIPESINPIFEEVDVSMSAKDASIDAEEKDVFAEVQLKDDESRKAKDIDEDEQSTRPPSSLMEVSETQQDESSSNVNTEIDRDESLDEDIENISNKSIPEISATEIDEKDNKLEAEQSTTTSPATLESDNVEDNSIEAPRLNEDELDLNVITTKKSEDNLEPKEIDKDAEKIEIELDENKKNTTVIEMELGENKKDPMNIETGLDENIMDTEEAETELDENRMDVADIEAELEDIAQIEAELDDNTKVTADLEGELEDNVQMETDMDDNRKTTADLETELEDDTVQIETELDDNKKTTADLETELEDGTVQIETELDDNRKTTADLEPALEDMVQIETELDDNRESAANSEVKLEDTVQIETELDDNRKTTTDLERPVQIETELKDTVQMETVLEATEQIKTELEVIVEKETELDKSAKVGTELAKTVEIDTELDKKKKDIEEIEKEPNKNKEIETELDKKDETMEVQTKLDENTDTLAKGTNVDENQENIMEAETSIVEVETEPAGNYKDTVEIEKELRESENNTAEIETDLDGNKKNIDIEEIDIYNVTEGKESEGECSKKSDPLSEQSNLDNASPITSKNQQIIVLDDSEGTSIEGHLNTSAEIIEEKDEENFALMEVDNVETSQECEQKNDKCDDSQKENDKDKIQEKQKLADNNETTNETAVEQEKESASAEECVTAQGDEENADEMQRTEGVDEEVCLLPDSEREISEADKERAILAKEAAEKDSIEENAEDSSEKLKKSVEDKTVDTLSTDNNTESRIGMSSNEDCTIIEDDPNEEVSADIPNPEIVELALKPYEIKELTTEVKEEKCFKCRKIKACKYKFLKDGERYLCSIRCVHTFRNACREKYTLIARKVVITWTVESKKFCLRCKIPKSCRYRFLNSEVIGYSYLCDIRCLNLFIGKNVEKYIVRCKKYTVEELLHEELMKCIHCGENKMCKYYFTQDDDRYYICHDDCFNLLAKEEPDRFRLKRRSVRVRDLRTSPGTSNILEKDTKIVARTEQEAEAARRDREASFVRRCVKCFNVVELNDRMLHWETFDFCNEYCLEAYQNVIGASCTTCKQDVPPQSLGKYCVRFGFEIRQFCRSACLDNFKKGLKVCSCCQKDISKDKGGFLAPVGDKSQFKDFCSQACMKRYEDVCNPRRRPQISTCAVCNIEKSSRVEITLDNRHFNFCSNPCFSAFKFVNNIMPDQCTMCLKYFERKTAENYTIYQDQNGRVFCCKICLNIYIILNRKIVPCQWCKVKKYNFDMIQRQCGTSTLMMCSISCLTYYGVSLKAISLRSQRCNHCQSQATPQYHLTMSDASTRNFCTYQCVMSFQSQFGHKPLTLDQPDAGKNVADNTTAQPFPTGLPKRVKVKGNAVASPTNVVAQTKVVTPQPNASVNKPIKPSMPVILNVASLAPKAAAMTTTVANTVATRSLRGGRGRLIPVAPPQPALTPPVETEQQSLAQLVVSPKRSSPITTRRTASATLPITTQTSETQTSAVRQMQSSHTQTVRIAKKSIGINVGDGLIEVQPPKAPTPPPEPEPQPTKIEYKTSLITVPTKPKLVANKQTMCKPATVSKGVSCRPHPCTVGCQTESTLERKVFIPIPVPIYVPQPMYMYSAPFPVPVPIPLPIPVPIFIPTTRNSAEGILKEIKKIQDKMPTDPFEAELLMMAAMVADEKKKSDSDSDSEPEQPEVIVESEYQTETIEPSNSFGEDVLQMALKMATEYDEPAVDLESAMTANTITPAPTTHMSSEEGIDDPSEMQAHHMLMIDPQRQVISPIRGRKRALSPAIPLSMSRVNRLNTPVSNKRIRRAEIQPILQPEPIREPIEKPDANMCLKYTFGVNAWKQWVMTKNADLEKSSIRRKPFKSELLQLTADELNYSLSLFVKEVRKPNGSEYAPDTIYYLVLGIQQYLYENNRIDNIFTDPYYERFTDCLDEVAKKFSVLYNDSQYIVTRVEEEHLWECKQLGAHSPHVLLSTLMFFNTKHFNLTTVEEHMQLSFSHIMKHWKRSPPGTKVPGSRNVLLRFYPPQTPEANPRKKKVYEQQENEENPLRCPVKLYEFYLSKCPESVKTRNDVFYLQPERSCVPDSPVWYSTQPLSKEALNKMLHRVKMVKEINIALLTS